MRPYHRCSHSFIETAAAERASMWVRLTLLISFCESGHDELCVYVVEGDEEDEEDVENLRGSSFDPDLLDFLD